MGGHEEAVEEQPASDSSSASLAASVSRSAFLAASDWRLASLKDLKNMFYAAVMSSIKNKNMMLFPT